MDTFRKWLNKPKADDKSLLAQFYHADRSLTAVASELDSFDGRAEPDRCSRLVSRLRRGQDHVLAITNQIMEELLGEDRDPRSFRAKFPEEVLQENLAGQLWFGAECLAAGSSIMNREEESKEMRPLAQAVTKSLDIVRNLLRDQCLRNNVPNSKTLHLDLNDSNTEQLYESLKIFDRLFAEFELRYVSAMVQVKTKHEYEMQELICVLFSETLQRALTLGLIEQDKVDAFDPALMFSIPRLAIIAGLVVYPKGPLNLEMPADQLSEMFRPFRMILIKIRDLLNTLSRQDLLQLERLLCTTEDHTKIPLGTSSIEAPSAGDQANNNTTSSSVQITEVTQSSVEKLSNNRDQRERELVEESSTVGVSNRSPSISPVYADISPHSTPASSPSHSPTPSHSLASTTSVSTESTNSAVDWTDDEEDDDDEDDDDEDAVDDIDTSDDEAGETLPKDIVSADCASGYLIPNTNFGNLLQPQEAPLTDNFIANDSEFLSDELFLDAEDRPTTSSAITATRQSLQRLQVPSSYDDDDDAQQQHETINNNNNTQQPSDNNGNNNQQPSSSPNSISISSRSSSQRQQSGCDSAAHCSRSSPTAATEGNKRPHRHHHHHHHHRHHNHSHSHHHHHHHHHPHPHRRSTGHHTTKEQSEQPATAAVQSNTENLDKKITTIIQQQETSSVDSSISSTSSDGDAQDVALAVRTANRRMFKSSDNLLHRLFVCIAGVADQLQTNFASDLRHILRSVFLMNMSIAQDDIEIPEKQKESELFEFRASENDVIQESAGSNQSIYSAEEVNPELDNVFNNNNNNNNSNSSSNSSFNHQRSNDRQSSGATMQRNNTIELGGGGGSANEPASSIRNQVGRSRSLGDHDSNEQAATTAANSQASINNCYNRRLSSSSSSTTAAATGSQQQYHHQHRNRNNSVGSNSNSSLSSSSETNSPVSERVLNNNNSSSNPTSSRQSSAGSTTTLMSPPAWIPDGKAPRCMACQTSFTPFRRRHHCRNCGGVFCGVCSNATAPLPKYGLTKAVRVCRECFVREGRTNSSSAVQQRNSIATATAGGS